jgi:apolipoprotein D and lipocalin family protein
MKPSKLIVIMSLIFLNSCKTTSHLNTVKEVDISKYQGLWYEIAKYPNTFQKNCLSSTATYSIHEKGYLIVENRCKKRSPEGENGYIKGKAFPVKNSNNSKLKVQFFWPFRANYWIIDLEPNYQWAVISEPKMKYLWILARKPSIDENSYQAILNNLKEKGFDLEKIEKTSH